MTFIDNCSRYIWVYFLRFKSEEVFAVFKLFLAYVENQFTTTIKTLRSNSIGEYMSYEFLKFLCHKGIVSQHWCPYMPQQNGMAKHKNQHLLDVA